MLTKRISRVICRIAEHPRTLVGRIKGFQSDHCFFCLTAEELLGKSPKTVIDVGANEGLFIDASNYIFPNAKIYAFEPLPELYAKIKNKDKVTAFNFGLWDKDGEDTIYYNKKNTGASSFLKPTEGYSRDIGKKEDVHERKALKKRFDKLNLKIERPCFLKIDVEGAEERVIKGFGERLNDVDIILVEWFFRPFHENQMKLSSLLPFLEKKGFTGFIQREFNSINGVPSTCNLMFFRTSGH